MPLVLSDRIREKLSGKVPPVSEQELVQCFANQTHEPLLDTRSIHMTDPPTRWFVGETDYGRKIKIMYVQREGRTHIKSAYDADLNIIRIYNKHAKPL